jgi:hypothetical protein
MHNMGLCNIFSRTLFGLSFFVLSFETRQRFCNYAIIQRFSIARYSTGESFITKNISKQLNIKHFKLINTFKSFNQFDIFIGIY